MIYLAVAVAGSLGAISRYLLDSYIKSRTNSPFPWGTYAVNISGSLALGAVVAAGIKYGISEILLVAVGTGFLGAYTTFSGWMVQTLQLIEAKALMYAFLNILISVIAGFLAAVAGFKLVIWMG